MNAATLVRGSESSATPHTTPNLSRREIDEAWKDLQVGIVGRLANMFSKFMYFGYEDWRNVASSPPYKQLHDALQAADMEMLPRVAAIIKQKQLKDVYSMGPSPSVDKVLLEQLVNEGVAVTYHPVDTSMEAVASTLEEITQHLTAKFGGKWHDFVILSFEKLMNFEETRSINPSCVVYSGGTMMNNRRFWEQAARIAKERGIVVASSAVTLDDGNWADYWLRFYDTPESKKMFENALRTAFPSLFNEQNRNKWEIKFEYVPENWSWADRWGLYQTPMVSVQLHVKSPVTLDVPDPVTGNPTKIRVTPSETRQYPIVLATSSKLNIAAFLNNAPQNFGLKPIRALGKERYILREIDYELNGQRGLVTAAIFDVAKPTVGAVPAYDLEPKLPMR